MEGTEGSGRLLTPKEVAARLGVSRDTVYSWIERRELEAIDLSVSGSSRSRWHVSEGALAAFMRRRSNTS